MRVTPEEYGKIELRAHSLLAGVPLHDVWRVKLPGGGPGRSILDLRKLLSLEKLTAAQPVARLFFGLRWWIGRVFGVDGEPPHAARDSFLHRLSADERERSLVAPGTRDGIFRILFVSPRESISEIQNASVHAFSVFALVERTPGYQLYWAIYVKPVGRITSWYMRLIDPFRRAFIYPAMLRSIRGAWLRGATERGATERGAGERGATERGAGERGAGERGAGERGAGESAA